jgi:hypothetical protein
VFSDEGCKSIRELAREGEARYQEEKMHRHDYDEVDDHHVSSKQAEKIVENQDRRRREMEEQIDEPAVCMFCNKKLKADGQLLGMCDACFMNGGPR